MRTVSDWLASPLLLWLLGSLLLYAVASNLLWMIPFPGSTSLTRRQRIGRGPSGDPLARARDRGQAGAGRRRPSGLVQGGLAFYYLGIPYLVLGGWPLRPNRGLLSPGDLGLAGLGGSWTIERWLQAAGTGVGLGFLSLLFLIVAWINANRAPTQHLTPLQGQAATGGRLGLTPRPAWSWVVQGFYLQVHWAFYRGALAVMLDDLYAGVFAGLVLVFLEWAADPSWRHMWRRALGAGDVWLHSALTIVSALLFLLTRNLWICLAVHWLLTLAFWLLARRQAPPPGDLLTTPLRGQGVGR